MVVRKVEGTGRDGDEIVRGIDERMLDGPDVASLVRSQRRLEEFNHRIGSFLVSVFNIFRRPVVVDENSGFLASGMHVEVDGMEVEPFLLDVRGKAGELDLAE